ncbi:restriction endonuclease [Bacillus cereus group sp. MYBK77-1]|uniref:restriction endonuclease n=1 Tax=Bacillus cereus group TaxID=86661 RepID=UPI0007729BED|nr:MULTISPECIES: restriction endonuclease [Bacillus cereus group]KXI70702.1 restriction endonuclease [Bacillus cereus]MCC2435642.1 restriction endonuclease [Bacillus paranthracis]MDX5916351.1 restriction endonuclease [Bacillus cereus group sp. BfR-BA-01026]
MTKWWMVRAGSSNNLVPIWRQRGVASIGWAELGNPQGYSTREVLIQKAHEVYEDEKPPTRLNWASQVWRFSHEVELGNRVITFTKDKREYLIGTVIATHQHDIDVVSKHYPNVIGVEWEVKQIPRDDLSQGAKNSLGSTLTVFRVDDWGNELEGLLKGDAPTKSNEVEAEEEEIIKEDLVQKALTMIQDKVDKLDPWQMQDLVAGLLQAMGYNVKVSKKGPDGGVDILAHKDAFGFEKPIIKVQVKHRKSTSGGPEVQQLLGAHPMDANSLFVSTGGFTSQAESIARNNNVKLLDLEELVNSIVYWYDKMPNETRSLLPLQKMYVPE